MTKLHQTLCTELAVKCFLRFSGESPAYFYAHRIQEPLTGRWAVQGMLFIVA